VAAPEPDLPDWLRWIWRAWWRLHDELPWRSGGMGPARPGRIPWTSVAAWCEWHGYGGDDEAVLEAGLAAMDAEFLAWHDEQQRAAEAARGRG
jgi:hypothetical protein